MLSLLDTLQGEALLPALKVPSQSSMKGVVQKAVLKSLEGEPSMRSLLDALQGQVLLLALQVLLLHCVCGQLLPARSAFEAVCQHHNATGVCGIIGRQSPCQHPATLR